MKNIQIAFTVASFLAATVSAFAEAEVGRPAPAFSLADVDGQTHTLAEHAGKHVVLEWTNYECPFVKKHYESGNMQKLQEAYTAKGVVWLSVNSSAPGKQGNFTPEEWKKRSAEWKSKASAILLDPDGQTGKDYGAKTTPHVFVVNPQGTLVYQGAIDDKPGTDPAEIQGARNHVQAALDESMAGNPVTEASTKSYGCSVKY